MKNMIIFLLMLTIGVSCYADTKYIHYWVAGTSAGWRSYIQLTNACNEDDVEATLKFWLNDGSILANTQISNDYKTDENGEIKVSLTPHQNAYISFHYNYFSDSRGSGTITSYTKSGDSCLVGGYNSTTTKSGVANPYGHSLGYLFNNGEKF